MTYPDQTRRVEHRALRLLLAALLAVAPLLAPANAASAATVADLAPMPCHGAPAGRGTIDAAASHDCPHCVGDAPLAQCQCCSCAAPAGIPSIDVSAHLSSNNIGYLGTLIVSLHPAPNEILFRPPIPLI